MNSSSCPICFEEIDSNTNALQTSCDHRFHTKCFLQHTKLNGYTCPYCRNELLDSTVKEHEVEAVEDTSYTLYNHDDNISIDENAIVVYEPDISPDDYSLHPFRWMMQQYNNMDDETENEVDTSLNLIYNAHDHIIRECNIIQEENSSTLNLFMKMIKNKVSYRDLLAAYLYHTCIDYRYCRISEQSNAKLSKTVENIHEKILYSSATIDH
jgi:hypothetical protein